MENKVIINEIDNLIDEDTNVIYNSFSFVWGGGQAPEI